jgi:transposase-like protein
LVVKTKGKAKEKISCPSCKSLHTVRHGWNVTKKGKYARRKCQECGTTFYENKEQLNNREGK